MLPFSGYVMKCLRFLSQSAELTVIQLTAAISLAKSPSRLLQRPELAL